MDAPPPLQRVEALLASVLQLTAEVLARRQAWRASVEEQAWMTEAANLTGHTIPPSAFTAAPAGLAFLLTARFALEAMAAAIRDSGMEPREERQHPSNEDDADD